MNAKAELKFTNKTLSFFPVSATGNITSLNLVAQGVQKSQRIGRRITIWAMEWRYDYFLQVLEKIPTPLSGDLLRLVVFIDKQANGATSVALDILDTADVLSPYNVDNKDRFVILRDVTHTINYAVMASETSDTVSQGGHIKQGSIFLNDLATTIQFSGGSGAVAELTSNNLSVLLISSNGTVRTNCFWRIRFTDH